ncbi:MAG: hypothetical protein J5663_09600 [Bacteroidaceae bacterium]|nr:hypothetical protein [Bacteroidaceae bacterium]
MARRSKEIIQLATSFILLQIIAKGMVIFALWLFRFFGMPQLWEWYRTLDHPGHTRFLIVLLFWMLGSIYWILKKRKDTQGE